MKNLDRADKFEISLYTNVTFDGAFNKGLNRVCAATGSNKLR